MEAAGKGHRLWQVLLLQDPSPPATSPLSICSPPHPMSCSPCPCSARPPTPPTSTDDLAAPAGGRKDGKAVAFPPAFWQGRTEHTARKHFTGFVAVVGTDGRLIPPALKPNPNPLRLLNIVPWQGSYTRKGVCIILPCLPFTSSEQNCDLIADLGYFYLLLPRTFSFSAQSKLTFLTILA